MPDPDHSLFASSSVIAHLTRGAIGFGLIAAGLGLTASVSPVALLLAPLGLVALRGCPMCWIAGLIETIFAGRLQRACHEETCALRTPKAPGHAPGT